MASNFLRVSVISRGKAHSAVAAAAYRARETLFDERMGKIHDYTRHSNPALFTGIFLPKDAPGWASDRARLWNEAERAEDTFNRKKNVAQIGRDMVLALPHEMTDQQREWLVKDFVREQFTRRGYAVDAAIHAPHEHGDERNYHAHLLITERTLGRAGFAPTKDNKFSNRQQLEQWKEQYLNLANRHLERHGITARLERPAPGHEAEQHMGKDAAAMERRGVATEIGNHNREVRTRNAERGRLDEQIKSLEAEQQRYERPMNVTQGQIFDARFASDNGRAFHAALGERGMALARVGEDEIDKANAGRPADWRPIAAGAIVAVTARRVLELTERSTGLTARDRANFLQDIAPELASVTAAQTALKVRAQVEKERQASIEPPRVWAPPARPVQRFGEAAESAGRVVSLGTRLLGGIEKIFMPLLGSLVDFLSGTPRPPVMQQDWREPPPPREPPRDAGTERIREQARLLSPDIQSRDPQAETIRRFAPALLTPEQQANVDRLAKAQAVHRARENERDDDYGRDRER